MNKKILIISNPGEQGAENYCEGVNVDVEQYINYFKSPLGGFWYESEISHLNRPTESNVKTAIYELATLDYSLILFCGHGWYSSIDRATILELRKGQELSEMELRKGGGKRTIVLDCCREVHEESIVKAAMESFSKARKISDLTPVECRKYYEKSISDASNGLIVTHACSISETAGDSTNYGGYYSGSLRECATDWLSENHTDLSKSYAAFSIVSAHEKACELVSNMSGGRQNPQIDRPRSKPYYPFAIVA
ncbi:caspase family protein [Vibrio anguillarum]|uniref:caspase family protein n=1 Tax=Vibrio anguillarum TaxID=55601 RepID=UPI0018C2138B